MKIRGLRRLARKCLKMGWGRLVGADVTEAGRTNIRVRTYTDTRFREHTHNVIEGPKTGTIRVRVGTIIVTVRRCYPVVTRSYSTRGYTRTNAVAAFETYSVERRDDAYESDSVLNADGWSPCGECTGSRTDAETADELAAWSLAVRRATKRWPAVRKALATVARRRAEAAAQ